MVPKVVNHWLNGASVVESVNFNERPDPENISLLVIHNISLPPGEFGGPHIDELFTNCLDPEAHPYFREICELEVSSHLLIRRDGALVQYVAFDQRAWHAGLSSFQGVKNCNDYAIGIELEGVDDSPYEAIQYDILVGTVAAILAAYPMVTRERIVGHSDIAPGRKTDPGPAFDWDLFHRKLQNHLETTR